jgi:hypothetical protein
MKRSAIDIPNLSDMTYQQTIELAYAIAKAGGKTYDDIADVLGKAHTTVQRYFTDPTYNPPTKLVPRLCSILGNNLLLEWQCVQADGHFVHNSVDDAHIKDLSACIAQLTTEFAELLTEESKARADHKYSVEELSSIQKEVEHMITCGEQLKRLLQSIKASAAVNDTEGAAS